MAIVVGLDIGSSAVRAVEVATRGRTVRVRRSGRVPLPPGAVEGGQVREPAEVSRACRRLWQEHKFSSRSVRLGIGSGSVLVRPVELEWMPAADLRKAMRYLVADLLPVPVDEANIDHVLLGEVERDGRRMARVLLVATAREGVDDVVRAVARAGLRPTTADLSPLALVRAAARAQAGTDDVGTEAVVDVGVDKLSVAVHTHGLPRFVRVIPGVGGSTLTRALAETTGEDDVTAEQHKLASDLTEPDAATHALRAAAQRLAHEVRDTLQFHAAADPGHPARRLVLTGLGAANPGFADVVGETVGLPTHVLAPPDCGRRRRPTDADLVVSYGLCLGASA
jgi:type IV pilus assembly protein PilM